MAPRSAARTADTSAGDLVDPAQPAMANTAHSATNHRLPEFPMPLTW
ncbi:MAG TPA: hypothetical protein VGI87_07105 [Solirubrobacteraceae bacterium]